MIVCRSCALHVVFRSMSGRVCPGYCQGMLLVQRSHDCVLSRSLGASQLANACQSCCGCSRLSSFTHNIIEPTHEPACACRLQTAATATRRHAAAEPHSGHGGLRAAHQPRQRRRRRAGGISSPYLRHPDPENYKLTVGSYADPGCGTSRLTLLVPRMMHATTKPTPEKSAGSGQCVTTRVSLCMQMTPLADYRVSPHTTTAIPFPVGGS